jgi:hypothetical protein
MATPLTEILVHKVTRLHAKLFGNAYDIDLLREMHEEEEDYVEEKELVRQMVSAGFENIERKYFLTQWGLNRLFVGWKR